MDDKKTDKKISGKEFSYEKNLDDLFSAAPPNELRQSIHEIYLTYIIQNHEMLPVNFTRIATHMYHLLHFLEKVEKE